MGAAGSDREPPHVPRRRAEGRYAPISPVRVGILLTKHAASLHDQQLRLRWPLVLDRDVSKRSRNHVEVPGALRPYLGR